MANTRQKPTRPLACFKCGSLNVRVLESAQQRLVGGRKRLHADCRCQNPRCRWQWWSRHEQALKESRAADRAAEAGR